MDELEADKKEEQLRVKLSGLERELQNNDKERQRLEKEIYDTLEEWGKLPSPHRPDFEVVEEYVEVKKLKKKK